MCVSKQYAASTLVKFSKLSHIQTTKDCGVSGALCYATA